ncbi:hypothetical protein PGB90_001919 [Kerria lacca]
MLIMENRIDADHLERQKKYNSNVITNNNIDNLSDINIEVSKKKMKYNSWHAHVYSNPPKTPTPHFIADILGWNCGEKIDSEDEPLNLTTRDRSPDDCITSSASEPVLLNGDSNSSRECRTPRRDSPIKSNTETGKQQLSRKNAAVKGVNGSI